MYPILNYITSSNIYHNFRNVNWFYYRYVDLSSNKLGSEGGKAIAEALKVNNTLTNINLSGNKLGSEAGKVIGEALKVNSTIVEIDLMNNDLGPEAGKVIAEALQNNTIIVN